MIDSKGVIQSDRTDLNVYKQAFAIDTGMRNVTEAMIDADVLIGLSGANTISPDMIRSMAQRAIVFALSNPDPEIYPEQIHAISDTVIVATGRSDYPNQVNNSLVFPFIFRAALDARLAKIDSSLLTAAVHCLADLAHQPVPDEVKQIYKEESLVFGPDYILPKQFDPRLCDHMVNGLKQAIEKL
jgi:malate dehydrogenase (oxaloacetate-decarboxylating)(NADP+)